MSFFDPGYLCDTPAVMRLKSGEDYGIEEQAAAWLAKGREGVTALRDKRDYLTKDQLLLRAAKEILPTNGFSDEAIRCGLFRRAFNPTFGHRPGKHFHHDDG